MMDDDTSRSLKEKIARLKAFSIALDDSTDASDTAQLVIFIRGVDADFSITEELLTLRPLKGTTTGKDIFETVNAVFERFGLNGVHYLAYALMEPLQWLVHGRDLLE
jgi:hypothetical protein